RIVVIKSEREMTFALLRPETERRFSRCFRACDAGRAFVVTEPIKLGVDAGDQVVRLRKFGIEEERSLQQRQRPLAVLLRIADPAPAEQLARLQVEAVGFQALRRLTLKPGFFFGGKVGAQGPN